MCILEANIYNSMGPDIYNSLNFLHNKVSKVETALLAKIQAADKNSEKNVKNSKLKHAELENKFQKLEKKVKELT